LSAVLRDVLSLCSKGTWRRGAERCAAGDELRVASSHLYVEDDHAGQWAIIGPRQVLFFFVSLCICLKPMFLAEEKCQFVGSKPNIKIREIQRSSRGHFQVFIKYFDNSFGFKFRSK
jgi:hypothetical protein